MILNCTFCQESLDLKEQVVLDVVNSLYHVSCYNKTYEVMYEWKDFGECESVIEKYLSN